MAVPKRRRSRKQLIRPTTITAARRAKLLTAVPYPHKYLYIDKKNEQLEVDRYNITESQ